VVKTRGGGEQGLERRGTVGGGWRGDGEVGERLFGSIYCQYGWVRDDDVFVTGMMMPRFVRLGICARMRFSVLV
jgi:hypothetical protein